MTATTEENCIKDRVSEIKDNLLEYASAKKISTDINLLEAKIRELFDGNGTDIASINQLIINSIKSRPENKSKSDQERLRKNEEHKFKIVDGFLDLAGEGKFEENEDPFLKSKLAALTEYAKLYIEELSKFYADKPGYLNNVVAQSMVSIPEKKELSVVEDPVPEKSPLLQNNRYICNCPDDVDCYHH